MHHPIRSRTCTRPASSEPSNVDESWSRSTARHTSTFNGRYLLPSSGKLTDGCSPTVPIQKSAAVAFLVVERLLAPASGRRL